MEWEKIGNNYPMEKDMFPVIIRRDDGKLFYIKSYPNLLKRKWLDCVSWVSNHRWTHILKVTNPVAEKREPKESELMPIELIPKDALELLYSKRLSEDINVPFEEYVKRYGFIVYNGVVYYNADSWDRVCTYKSSPSEFVKLSLPDAVIICDNVIGKNRYGNRSV